MKLTSSLVCGALALTICNSYAATRVFNITGATAFRASANNAIISILGGAGTTQYAYTGSSGVAGTNRAIFKGTMAAFPGDEIIVRASWSGSTQGIKDVANQTAVQVLKTTVAMSTSGTLNAGLAADFETAVAQWSFSDVDKALSEKPNYAFNGGPIGVVPFMFLAGEGAPAALNNMTDQLHEKLWSTGQLPIAFFTGDTNDDTFVLATGRNNGSGTRALILAETQYGAFEPVVQYGATISGTRTDAYPTAKLTALSEFNNGGNSSNSGVRDLLTRQVDPVSFEGNYLFVSYLTISDAISAKTEGAQEMTYNGVAFSADNVKKGAYTLWGYQQFYRDSDATAQEITFDTAFRTAIPATLNGIDAIALSDMSVTRTGGDGGPVAPNDNYPNP
jgi:hypothetical protein